MQSIVKDPPITALRMRCQESRELSGVWMPREDALTLLSTLEDFLAACEAAIEATGGSEIWNGKTQAFLRLMEAAISKAKGLPAGLEAEGEA